MRNPQSHLTKTISLLTLFAVTILSVSADSHPTKAFADSITPITLIAELRKIRASPKKLALVLRVDDAYHSQEYDPRS
jgi:hypothetical protein